jgi:hypothetical protein
MAPQEAIDRRGFDGDGTVRVEAQPLDQSRPLDIWLEQLSDNHNRRVIL